MHQSSGVSGGRPPWFLVVQFRTKGKHLKFRFITVIFALLFYIFNGYEIAADSRQDSVEVGSTEGE
jgi:hypothetical protein